MEQAAKPCGLKNKSTSLLFYSFSLPFSYFIWDYKRSNPRVNTGLAILLYVCVAHTHEPNPFI